MQTLVVLFLIAMCAPMVSHSATRPRIEVLAPASRTPGTYAFAARNISATATKLGLIIDRTSMATNPEMRVLVRGEVSSDGGVTWEAFSAEMLGGTFQKACKPKPCTPLEPETEAFIQIDIQPGATKMVRGALNVIGRSATLKVEVISLEP